MTDRDPEPAVSDLLGFEGETFTVYREEGEDVELRLRTVDVCETVDDEWEQFVLRFDPVGDPGLEQDLYRVGHPGLGAFDATLSPTPTPDPDPKAVQYEAVFNRHRPGMEGTAASDGRFSRRGILASLVGAAAGWSLLGELFGGGTSGPIGTASAAGQDPYIGSIEMFGFQFAPQNWAKCNGQLLPISQNNALFSLLGTQYGGDGRTTFRLPDLRGRVPIHQGQGPDGNRYSVGQTGGSSSVALSSDEIPAHDHGQDMTVPVSTDEGDALTPDGNALAAQPDARGETPNYTTGPTDGSMDVTGSVSSTGGGQAHENMPPYQTVNYCIALRGTYPSRD